MHSSLIPFDLYIVTGSTEIYCSEEMLLPFSHHFLSKRGFLYFYLPFVQRANDNLYLNHRKSEN